MLEELRMVARRAAQDILDGENPNVETFPDPHGKGVWLRYSDGTIRWVKGAHFTCIYFSELTPERMALLRRLVLDPEHDR